MWGVNCEDSGENWPRQHGTALYVHIDGLVQGRRNSNAIAPEPRPPHQPIDIHMYPKIISSVFTYINALIIHGTPSKVFFISSSILCHQCLRQWRLTTIGPWAIAWARDDQGVLSSNSFAEKKDTNIDSILKIIILISSSIRYGKRSKKPNWAYGLQVWYNRWLIISK